MQLDLRVPIGLLFAIYGLILVAEGLTTGIRVLGTNVTLWWGLVLLLFGLAALYVGSRRRPDRG